MFNKMLTTTLALAFASLAMAGNITVEITTTLTIQNAYTTYTTTSATSYETASPVETSGGPVETTGSPVQPPPDTVPKIINITVGVGADNKSALVFTPSNITANVGDVIQFFFGPKNHTATQSSFDKPCDTLANGFDSGFTNSVSEVQTEPGFKFRVNDTKPIWAHCRQEVANVSHCASGMVFSVNAPPTGNTFDAFKANAEATNPNANSANSSSTPSGSGARASSTAGGGDGSGAMAISVNYGLTVVLALIGSVIVMML